MEEDEPEEGEICPNEKIENNDGRENLNMEDNGIEYTVENSPVVPPPVPPVDDRLDDSRSLMVDVRNETGNSCSLGNKTTSVGDTTCVEVQSGPNNGECMDQGVNRLLKNLVPLGCFGPFPSTFVNNGSNGNTSKGRKHKRRRAYIDDRSCSPVSSPAQSVANEVRTESIDLNANPRLLPMVNHKRYVKKKVVMYLFPLMSMKSVRP
ncbi:hypothetical protein L1887_41820 [Cichorium endivia]|nr:hypothetical protein L1887_41820 [Cichorium endivia]